MRAYLIAAAVLALASGHSLAQSIATTEPSVTVHGQGRAQVPPDHANLTVEVETKAKTAADATAAHRERAARAVNALREMKPDRVEIVQSNFRLGEFRAPPAPSGISREASPEYQAVTSFELKMTRVDAVDGAITKIASTGLFQVRNLRFGVSDDNPGADTARKRAVANARERATAYAQAAGVQLGDIVKIEDLEAQGPVLFAAQAPAMRSVQVIPPESLTLSASVTITWKIAR
jgi:uncharacterized protein YggE